MKLTIAICTIPSRKSLFDRLVSHLKSQSASKEFEVISDCDNKTISVGVKRQKLLEAASGDYVAFIDDDDTVPDDYVNSILEAIKLQPDAIGFKIHCSGCEGVTASASNRWKDWGENEGGYDYVRTPYHKTPIRREIALKIGFKDMRFSEDYDFSKRLKQSGLIKTEEFINKVMYYYRYKFEDPKTKFGIK